MPESPEFLSPADHHTARRDSAAAQEAAPGTSHRVVDPQRDAQNRQFVLDAARLVTDLHCEDVVIFDVRGLTDMTDYIMIASGTSDRQIKSVADDLEDLAETAGLGRMGRELDAPSKWLVLDFIDVVVHLFDPETRAHYDLEMLWGDAERVHWCRTEAT